jgi:hypothetical protein
MRPIAHFVFFILSLGMLATTVARVQSLFEHVPPKTSQLDSRTTFNFN